MGTMRENEREAKRERSRDEGKEKALQVITDAIEESDERLLEPLVKFLKKRFQDALSNPDYQSGKGVDYFNLWIGEHLKILNLYLGTPDGDLTQWAIIVGMMIESVKDLERRTEEKGITRKRLETLLERIDCITGCGTNPPSDVVLATTILEGEHGKDWIREQYNNFIEEIDKKARKARQTSVG